MSRSHPRWSTARSRSGLRRLLAIAMTALYAACSGGTTETRTVASVRVNPASQSIQVGHSVQLTASPEDGNGAAVTGQSVSWSSGSLAIATVSASGLVSGIAAGGPVTISATAQGVTGSASITVTPVPVAQVTVTPASVSIIAGAATQLVAATKDAGGTVLSGRPVTWTSSNNALATVSATGQVTGLTAGGPVTVTANSEGITGTAAVTIEAGTVYDAANDISWLTDADLPASNRFGVPLCTGTGNQTCVNPSGSMRYDAAVAWVAGMNAANYLGHADWLLPTSPVTDNNCGRVGPNGNSFGFGCTRSALATMYDGLGLSPPNSAVPITTSTIGPFSNLQPYLYWSQTTASATSGNATFSFATGWQGANTLPNFLYAWPMTPGKLAGTPAASGSGLQINPGGQTIYDPMTDVTWLANANLAASNRFGLPVCTDPLTPALCVAADGAMTLASTAQFLANMNAAAYLGQTNWQLPAIDAACPGYNCSGVQNPMGNLFYTQLGLLRGGTVASPHETVGPFHNIQPYLYWSCAAPTIQSTCDPDGAAPNFQWSFSFGSGFQGTDLLANSLFVTAYHVGRGG